MLQTAAPRIWLEVDDLVRYFDHHATPTGIGRVQLEIIPHLLRLYPSIVGIIRIGRDADDVRVIPPEKLGALLNTADTPEQRRTSTAFATWLTAIARLIGRRIGGLHERWFVAARQRSAFTDSVAPGDVILALGASWSHAHFGRSVRTLKARHGLSFALLVHDILPISHPDQVMRGHQANFIRWLGEMIASWDVVLTPSNSSAEALTQYLRENGNPVPPISAIPFGFGFGPRGADAPTAVEPVETEPYVLSVSTIEVRKNHILLYRIWERLIARHGAAAVPKLVFVGSMGWGIEPLKRAMASSNGLDGKIAIVSHLSDAQVSRAYADCLFTVFPSLCEGWGLPVSESIFHGRLCIASHATSIPEIGGEAVDYFDPLDEDAAMASIERALFEPGYVQSREQWARSNFEVPTWDGTARAIVERVTAKRPGPVSTISVAA